VAEKKEAKNKTTKKKTTKKITKKKDETKVGRPTKFKEEYIEQGYKLALLGHKDEEMASFFEVDVSTVQNWKHDYPEFLDSIKRGKEESDFDVAKSLYHRAIGYSHEDVHISNFQGEITITPVTKHYPPDPTSAIFWLKNRQRKNWRDKQEIEQKIEIKDELSEDEVNEKIKKLMQKLSGD